MNPAEASRLIKEEALRLGFTSCGICRAEPADDQAAHLQGWLGRGCQGEMHYLERNIDKRTNPSLLVENTQSIVVVALNYFPDQKQDPKAAGISYYAYGKDYHLVVKEKLKHLLAFINSSVAPARGRMFCDSAPVFEKHLAQKAGLGWIGRNKQLILPGRGSFFFLGELFLNLILEYDAEYTENHCGACRKCIAACPTHALNLESGLDARRCLAYLSIEHQGELPDYFSKAAGKQVYGCDLCNKACPHNRQAAPTSVEEFHISEDLKLISKEQILEMSEEEFNRMFKNSPIGRIGLDRLKRNTGEA